MYRLVIFDLDGTLLDTIGDLAAAGNHALELLGLPRHDEAAFKRFVGNGIPKLIERMLPPDSTEGLRARALELFTKYYSAHKADNTIAYHGMKELVAELSRSGVICCVNSNKAQDFSEELVRSAFGSDIKAVAGYGGKFPPKPAPDAVLELIKRYGAELSQIIYIGDSDVDIMTANAAGIDCCAVLWGFRPREELEKLSPKYFAQSAAELEKIILK